MIDLNNNNKKLTFAHFFGLKHTPGLVICSNTEQKELVSVFKGGNNYSVLKGLLINPKALVTNTPGRAITACQTAAGFSCSF